MQHTEGVGNRRWGSKSGFTLIELLVVVLIITILAIALLPALDPFITRAKYAADGIPMIGNLRTQVQLYQYEKEHLPGLNRYVDGTPIVATNGILQLYGNSQLHDDTDPTNSLDATAAAHSMTRTGELTIQGNTTAPLVWATLGNADFNHYTVDLDLAAADFEGRNVRPENFTYSAFVGGYKNNNYAYALGVFGDGEGIKSGTGYAVVEVYNKSYAANPKILATFRRWRPQFRKTECTVDQMGIMVAGPLTGISFPVPTSEAGKQALANGAWVDTGLMSTNSAEVIDAIGKMRAAGWEL